MPGFADIAAAVALALPAIGLGAMDSVPEHSAPPATPLRNSPEAPEIERAPTAPQSATAASMEALIDGLRLRQIRIEQRVIVRIAPQRAGSRRNLLAQLPVRTRTTRYQERKKAQCVKLEQIAGVETGSGNRLLLFMRDAEIMSINLEKACRARDFYSGFYVERNKDGNMCVDRDTLQSRNGARCDIERMMQLEAIED